MVYLLVILDVQTVTHPFKRETNNEENLGSNFFHEFYLRFKKTTDTYTLVYMWLNST